jgi:DNA-binding transcriptional LysR family regulator
VSGAAIADSFEFVRGLVKGGVGIGLLPELGLNDDVATGALVRILPAYALRGGALYVVTPPLRHVPVRVALLRAYLIDELSRRMAGPR